MMTMMTMMTMNLILDSPNSSSTLNNPKAILQVEA